MTLSMTPRDVTLKALAFEERIAHTKLTSMTWSCPSWQHTMERQISVARSSTTSRRMPSRPLQAEITGR